ncbi:DISARM system phospholipase D-like protein DrmC [Micromonospora carbonacea]|uniref:DISARM system phospholipase D-like protein DrmC n=1 Tax=Micromonospora carbonacea TaxID=47853 RepID=UPI003D95F65D
MKDLIHAVVAIGRASPHQQVLTALTEALTARPTADATTLGALRAVVATTPALRPLVEQLMLAWQASTGVTGAALAGMLACAYEVAAAERAALRVEPVVTGPQSRHVPLRATRQAFESITVAARQELLVLTYSAHTDARIVATLGAAINRGVQVRILVETTRAEGGTLSTPALDALAGLPAQFYVWDPARRPRRNSPASMHAKGVVADGHSAFLTSANLSGHAFEANVEVGVRIVGGDVPARLRDHFRALIADAVFVPVTPNPI